MLIDNYVTSKYSHFNHKDFTTQKVPAGYPIGKFGVFSMPIDPYSELVSVNPTELRLLFEEQYKVMIKESEVMVAYGLISKASADVTRLQYSKYYFHTNEDKITTVYHKQTTLLDAGKKNLAERTTLGSDIVSKIEDEDDDSSTDVDKEEYFKVFNEIKPSGDTSIKTIGISVQSIRNITGYSYTVQKDWHPKPVTISWQKRMLEDSSNILIINGSRQMGKSYAIAEMLIEESFIPGADILVAAFLQKTTNAILNYMKKFLHNFNEEDFTIYKKDGFIYNNTTGVSIHFRTLDDGGENALGLTLRLIVVDEAQKILPSVFEDVLNPTLTTTGGRIIMIGTSIEDTSSYMFKTIMEYKKGVVYNNEGQKTCKVIDVSVDDNPLVHPLERRYIEDRKDTPAIKRQYYNRWGKMEDSAFQIKPVGFDSVPPLHKQGVIIYAIDPARKQDKSGWSVFYCFKGKAIMLSSGEVPANFKVNWDLQAQYHLMNIEKLRKSFDTIYTVVDMTGIGDGVVHIFRSAGLTVNYTVVYTGGISESTQDECNFNVGKSLLISNTLDFVEMNMLIVIENTNKLFIEETNYISLRQNRFGQQEISTEYTDDVTNSAFIGLYIIKKFQFHYRNIVASIETNSFGKEIDARRGNAPYQEDIVTRNF